MSSGVNICLYHVLLCYVSECQGVAALSQEPTEAPPAAEKGPPLSQPLASTDEPLPEKLKGEAERERPDSETESDVDDP